MRLFSKPPKPDVERRETNRRSISETLFIESVSSEKLSPLDNEPAVANTIDASSRGMQVELNFPVLEDSEIALWINHPDTDPVLISGAVRWVNEQEPGRFLVGISLDKDSAPMVERWLAK